MIILEMVAMATIGIIVMGVTIGLMAFIGLIIEGAFRR